MPLYRDVEDGDTVLAEMAVGEKVVVNKLVVERVFKRGMRFFRLRISAPPEVKITVIKADGHPG